MKTWILLAIMSAAFSTVGLVLTVIAFVTGEWGLLAAGLLFLAVGLMMAAYVPTARREQNAAAVHAPVAAAGTVPFAQVADLIRERLAGSPYTVELEGSRILVRADLADAEFLGWASAHKVKVVRGVEVIAKRPGLAITRDFEQDLDLSLGVGRATGALRVQSGRIVSFERRVELGVGKDGRLGRQVDVRFSSKEIQDPINAVLKETGWGAGFWSSLPADGKVGVIMAGFAGVGAVVTVVALLGAAALGKFS